MAEVEDGPTVEAFFGAVRGGRVHDIGLLLAERPSLIDSFDPSGWCCRGTPLNVAVGNGDRETIDELLAAGADIDRKSDWWAGGFAPIHSVPREHRPWLTQYLLDRGATVDVIAAADHGMVDRLTALLDEVPDRVNQPGGDGGRPLHFAADPEVAALLLARGALLDPRDVDHWSTPAQWAARNRSEVTRFLLERGAAGDIFMYAAIDARERLETVLDDDPTAARSVLDEAFFPSPGSRAGHMYCYTLGAYGSTVLHVAATMGRVEVARMLLVAGADPDARGGYDEGTPLHAAAWNGRADTAELLVRSGATIDIESGSQHRSTPLAWGIANGKYEVVARLLALGAEVRDGHRKTLRDGMEGRIGFSSARHSDYERIAELVDRHDRGD